MARVRLQKPKQARVRLCCHADSWHDLLVAINRTQDEVRMRRKPLEDVLACHRRHGGSVSRDLLIQDGTRKVVVRRSKLWAFVQDHGKLCS